MRILDTSYCADFLRGYDHAKQYRLDRPEESLVLPSVGFYELYRGAVTVGRDPGDVARDLPWVDRLEYTSEHAREGARIRAELEDGSRRMQHPDMMIAGVARSLDVPVVSTDAGFDQVDDLVVENSRELYG